MGRRGQEGHGGKEIKERVSRFPWKHIQAPGKSTHLSVLSREHGIASSFCMCEGCFIDGEEDSLRPVKRHSYTQRQNRF